MKLTIIVVIVLLGLFDFSMFVMCSHMEDRNQYYHEKHLRGEDDGRRHDEDTIRREDALQALVESDVRGYEYRQLEDAIKAIPSADRPQGEWFKDDEGTFICSACGSGYKDQPTLMGKPLFKWCPLCGAKMKGACDDI